MKSQILFAGRLSAAVKMKTRGGKCVSGHMKRGDGDQPEVSVGDSGELGASLSHFR